MQRMVHGRQDHVMSGSRELLWLAVVLMWSQVTEVTASPQPMKSVTFEMVPVSDVKFTQEVLWEKPVKSKIDCVKMCVGEARCSMFTFTPSTDRPGGSCRIHGKRQTPQGEQESAPGARNYNIVITDFWIMKACTNNSDCTDPMAACYSGQCLCDRGLFFDYYQNACEISCTWSLGDTFVEYRGWYVSDGMRNLYSTSANGDITSCRANCSANPQCVGFSYDHWVENCFHKERTLTLPIKWNSNIKKDFHLRMCQ